MLKVFLPIKNKYYPNITDNIFANKCIIDFEEKLIEQQPLVSHIKTKPSILYSIEFDEYV